MSTRSCAVRVTIFSTGGKFRPVSNFTELHTLTLAACFYALLYYAQPYASLVLLLFNFLYKTRISYHLKTELEIDTFLAGSCDNVYSVNKNCLLWVIRNKLSGLLTVQMKCESR